MLSGAALPFTDMTLPIVGAGLTDIIGGIIAGYVAGSRLDDGALNGGIAIAVGAIVALVILILAGLMAGPIPAIGLFGYGVLFVMVAAIPGIIGGVIGSWLYGAPIGAVRHGLPDANPTHFSTDYSAESNPQQSSSDNRQNSLPWPSMGRTYEL
nr:DUF5518 domain-containing protein [Haladaptatus halobius]